MPFVFVNIAAGRTLEKRRRLAQAITSAVSEILELEPGQTQVVIQEHDRDNWAIGGELLSERQRPQTPELLDLDSLFKKPAPAKKPAPSAPAKKPAAKPQRRR
jgi:4-oxalocrotonate tautomerase